MSNSTLSLYFPTLAFKFTTIEANVFVNVHNYWKIKCRNKIEKITSNWILQRIRLLRLLVFSIFCFRFHQVQLLLIFASFNNFLNKIGPVLFMKFDQIFFVFSFNCMFDSLDWEKLMIKEIINLIEWKFLVFVC